MKVLVSDRLHEVGLDLLRREAEVDYRPGLQGEEFRRALAGADALIIRSGTRVTAEDLVLARRLRVIGRAGVGVNNVDLEAATEAGVLVVNVPDANTISAAEHTLALLLALARNIPAADANLRRGGWDRKAFTGVELRGKILGIIGLGRIGGTVARLAASFGIKVLAHDPYVSSHPTAELVELDRLLKEADFVTVHCPLNAQTRGLLGRRELALMKGGSYLINVARGGIVDEAALAESLRAGHLAGVAADVFSTEPPPPDHPLLRAPRTVLTPHLGASTEEALRRNAVVVAEQVLAVLRGEPAANAVNQPPVEPDEWREAEPFFALAEAVGRLYAQLPRVNPGRIEIWCAGIPAGPCFDLVTGYALKGALATVLASPPNHINATRVAAKRGISVRATKLPDAPALSPYPDVVAMGDEDIRVAMSLAGSGYPRLVYLNGYRLDIAPGRFTLVTVHRDVPGVVGMVGTRLGQAGVNIASMQVARRLAGGEATMVVHLDEEPSPVSLAGMAGEGPIEQVYLLRLPGRLVNRADSAAS